MDRASHNIPEASAEMLLNYLYPELEKEWIARHNGTFYRNYNADIMSVNPEGKYVNLSRDGFLRLIPQGLFTQDNELKGNNFKDKYEALKKRELILSEAFLPFDTFTFRQRLHLEREISELLNEKLNYLLLEYFHFDLAKETNPYVKEAAVLLPYVSQWRGNFKFIRNLLSTLARCEVNMTIGKYSDTDNTRLWMPQVKYHLLMNGLDSEEYSTANAEILPLRQFIIEWFIPFDIKCDIQIKQYDKPFTLNEDLVLNYNTAFHP